VLRIIAGKYRGIKLDEVMNDSTRPTTDKNKEMLFNILGQFFEGGVCLDLFSGSGALGIEALSRGIDHVTFVDSNSVSLSTIKKNIAKIKEIESHSFQILKKDALDFLKSSENIKYDLILADPPYDLDIYDSILDVINKREILNVGGILVLEADKSRNITYDDKHLNLIREKSSGNTKFFIYERVE